MTRRILLATAALLSISLGASATTYTGNGNTGFGGAIGLGSLSLTDDGTNVYATFTRGSGYFNDVLVFYIDSTAGGFSDTSGFADGNDGLRRAISGFDGGANRSTLTFSSGFLADYALALGPSSDGFGGLWQLNDGGGNSLGFLSSANLNPLNNSSATYTFSFSLASIGLTPGDGQSFDFFATYISNTGNRSDETLGGTATGSQGWNPFTETAYSVYNTLAVPEPSSMALVGLGTAALIATRRRK